MNYPLTKTNLEFSPIDMALVKYDSFDTGAEEPLTADQLQLLNTRPPNNIKPTMVTSFQNFTAEINLDDVLMPEHYKLMIFIYAIKKIQNYIQDIYNPAPAPWGNIALSRFRPETTGAVVEDSKTVSGSLPESMNVVAALIVVRGLFKPYSVHIPQTYEPREPEGGGNPTGPGGVG